VRLCPALLLFVACGTATTNDSGSTSPTGTEGCEALCLGAGFDGGEERDYAPVIECVCSGTDGSLSQADCASYCATFGVSAESSFLSMNAVANDKCVCDGTGA
jgi:hypothetical protein